MTISSETARVKYTPAVPGTVVFATTFKFLANGDIKVILRDDTTEVETVQVETTHYTLSGAGDASGGDVTMLTAVAVGESLVIKRNMTLTQGTDYVENDDFPAAAHETALDSVVMIAQQINERGDRSLHFKESSGLTDVELPDAEADKFLRWNTAADGFDNVTVAEGSSVSSASETVEGIAELATQTEVDNGTDDLRIVTPLKLRALLGASGVKSSAFSVHKNGSNQAGFVTGVYKKVTWSATEDFDSNGDFASDRFSPTIAGKYLLTAQIGAVSATDGTRTFIAFYDKNGNRIKVSTRVSYTTSDSTSVPFSIVVDADGSTDFYEVWYRQDSGSNQTISGGVFNTWFMGARVL